MADIMPEVWEFLQTENKEDGCQFDEKVLQEIAELLKGAGDPEYRPLAKLLLWNWPYIEEGLRQMPETIKEAIRRQAEAEQRPWKNLAVYWLVLEGRDLRPKNELLNIETV